jgi:hypothetical protein
MISCSGNTPAPRILMGSVESIGGKLRGSFPNVNSTMLSSTMPPATVAISQALEPRAANGRTSVHSTSRPKTAQARSESTKARGNGQPSRVAKV